METQDAEKQVLAQTERNKDVNNRFNISGDDILPTGSGAGAMTALVTHIFLDPHPSAQLQVGLRGMVSPHAHPHPSSHPSPHPNPHPDPNPHPYP